MAVARLAVCVPDGEGIRREDTLYVVPFTQDADNPMIVVALDTTTRAGSVAILRAGEILTSRKGDADRTHGERLPNDILTLLTEVVRAPADVDLYAVCSGPGSFTGLRVGLATIQGLAMATGRPVVTIPTLEALAYAGWWSDQNLPAPVTPARVIPLMNAQRGELFAAVYLAKAQPLQRDGRGMTLEIAPFVGTPTAVVDRLASTLEAGPVVLVGDGVSDAQPLLEGVGDVRHLILSHLPPLAPVVARLAEGAADSDRIAPHAIRPVYVRRPDAELARERRQAGHDRAHT